MHLLNKELHVSHSTDTDDYIPARRNMKKKPKVSEVCLWITKELTHLCQYYTGDPSRIKAKVSFPLRLEIGEFMSRANRSKPPPYELVSVLVHQGRSCNSGHYLSYVKSDGEWYRASDENVEKVPVNIVLSQRAYILIYEVEGMRNHKIRQAGNDSRSFEGLTTSQSVLSSYTHPSLDSVVSARSKPTVLSSIFQMLTVQKNLLHF